MSFDFDDINRLLRELEDYNEEISTVKGMTNRIQRMFPNQYFSVSQDSASSILIQGLSDEQMAILLQPPV
jgi:hypothetical protein